MATEIEAPMKAKGMVHKVIADTAKGMAEVQWEQLCGASDKFYKAWPDVRKFVRLKWPLYVDLAKQTLIGMLGDPNRPDHEKEAIAEVVLRDGAVNPKKMATPEKPSFFLKP